MECRPEARPAHRASAATLPIRPLTRLPGSLTPCESGSLRQLRASEAGPHWARQCLLDVPALEDRRALPEVSAYPGGALSGLRMEGEIVGAHPAEPGAAAVNESR